MTANSPLDGIACCENCRFWRGPKKPMYIMDSADPNATPWYCMHPDNAHESFIAPIEDCYRFQPNTFGWVVDPKARTHYWITEGPEGLGLEGSDDRWPF